MFCSDDLYLLKYILVYGADNIDLYRIFKQKYMECVSIYIAPIKLSTDFVDFDNPYAELEEHF